MDFSGTVAQSGNTLVAGPSIFFNSAVKLCGGAARGACCGNGIVDPGEACDGPCCTGTCQAIVAAGTPCPAGDPCSTGQCDGTGSCTQVAAPATGCLNPAKASFQVKKKKPGKEKLKVALKNLTVATTPGNFGNPVTGTTSYALCVYDQAGARIARMQVARAEQMCGDKPCWKATKTGYSYTDKTASADGITKIRGQSGDPNKGKIDAEGQNNATKGQTSLPTGIAAMLLANSQATVQILTSDASCFGATLSTVTKNDGLEFKAKLP